MFNINDYKNSHQSVEGKNVFYQKPQIGDIVECFKGKVVGVVVAESFHDGKGEKVFEVVKFSESQQSAMPFQSEVKVIAKRNNNMNKCRVNEINAEVNAQMMFNQVFDNQ